LRARGKGVLALGHDDEYFHVAYRVVKLTEGQLRAIAPRAARRGCGPGGAGVGSQG